MLPFLEWRVSVAGSKTPPKKPSRAWPIWGTTFPPQRLEGPLRANKGPLRAIPAVGRAFSLLPVEVSVGRDAEADAFVF